MIFGYFIFFVALIISAVAEYYSIMGLTAIFSAAYWSVVIMGVALGIGKITAAVWLKLNWDRASWTYKMYLVPAVGFLMFLTSMGIFGFLSKAHSDIGIEIDNVNSRVAIYDEKIKIANSNIDANKKVLKQLDDSVDQVLERSTNEQGALRSIRVRISQQKERKEIANNIAEEQEIIRQLTEERSKNLAEVRKVEAEVGPIKYIAAMIYGNNPDANLLESAVSWVIILIVLVFDPLALCLMLAAQQSIRWAKEDKIKNANSFLTRNSTTDTTQIKNDSIPLETNANVFTKNNSVTETDVKISSIEFPEIHDFATKIQSNTTLESSKLVNTNTTEPGESFNNTDITITNLELAKEELVADNLIMQTPNVKQDVDKFVLPPPPPETSAPKAKEIIQVPETIDRNNNKISATLPLADNDNNVNANNFKAHFGIAFPTNPVKSELFLRVDYLPSRLFKFNGNKWIEVDKSLTDSYVYNTEYIKFMIKEIDAGRLDPDDLNTSEREQIAEFLAKDEQNRNPS